MHACSEAGWRHGGGGVGFHDGSGRDTTLAVRASVESVESAGALGGGGRLQ